MKTELPLLQFQGPDDVDASLLSDCHDLAVRPGMVVT